MNEGFENNFTFLYDDWMFSNSSNEYFTPKTNVTYVGFYLHQPSIAAIFIVSYMLIFLVCMVGNGVVCFIVLRSKNMRTVTNLFILNLAVSDLLVGIFCMPTTLLDNIITDCPEEMKNRLYVVFEAEEGQDAGGLLREWYTIISREMFNPMYALFCTSPGDRVTNTINPASHCNANHLSYFKFVGRVVAKAVYDNRLLECYFTRSFYNHILGKSVRYTDMESEDYPFFQGLVYLLENDVSTLGYELTFSTEVQEFGVCEVRELKPNGTDIPVTEENKKEYVHLVCQMKTTGAIRKQTAAFLEGFYQIIPKRLISIFSEQELELLISGLPTVDIEDLKVNTEYHKYQSGSVQIQWFWRALRSLELADRAKFLQFVTGTSKVPLQGFASLEGMSGTQRFQIHRDDRSTDRLPSAHTCFNQLDLPAYENYDKLRHMLLLAIQECSEGFGLA